MTSHITTISEAPQLTTGKFANYQKDKRLNTDVKMQESLLIKLGSCSMNIDIFNNMLKILTNNTIKKNFILCKPNFNWSIYKY